MITSNHMTETTCGSLDIFTKEINILFFNFASGKILGQEQNATTFFARLPQEFSQDPVANSFPLKPLGPSYHNLLAFGTLIS